MLYAAIELDRRTGGVWRSSDRGSTWSKQSETVSGGTGPHYYQELYACPHHFDRIYLADVRMQVSHDGGKNFVRMQERDKHSDNHALAFRKDDPDWLLAGCDGGLYESFDGAQNWRFLANLPVTQFYKIALDDTEPFYNVYGGTQDNSTEGGPVRTDNLAGIRNSDWRVVLDWDGHQPATEPGNPDILYAERQEGFLSRVDLTTGEIVDIQPQPEAGADYERFNWDAPILVSPHQKTRLYFASHRVFRSDNRGDSWRAVSPDLTRNEERFALPIMGSTQSWDEAWDVLAMSNYNTITSLAESPLQEGLLYVGTDDGLIQVSEDGGDSWRKLEVAALGNVPARAFVNDIRADLHDADTVYVALDNHKEGDFAPYLFVSRDRGRSWQSIGGSLPTGGWVWRLVQDHVDRDLLFAGTERGVYFSPNGGERWTRLVGGMPTISIRDLKIHRRDNDLVCASFGRGIFVLDDIDVLRHVDDEQLAAAAALFPVRKTWWYFPRSIFGFEPGKGAQGAAMYAAPNPPFGAVFTYWLRDDLQTRQQARAAEERAAGSAGATARFPGWDRVETERREQAPRIWLTVRDAAGAVVRRIVGPTKRGFHRVAWDLRHPTPNAITMQKPAAPDFGLPPRGMMAAPGRYTVTMSSEQHGEVTQLGEPQPFDVVPLRKGALAGAEPAAVAAFWREYEAAVRNHTAMQVQLAGLLAKTERMRDVIANARAAAGNLDADVHAERERLLDLDRELNGDGARKAPGEKHAPTIESRLSSVSRGVGHSTYGPTATHREQLAIAKQAIAALRQQLDDRTAALTELVRRLVAMGAPWLEGEPLPPIGR